MTSVEAVEIARLRQLHQEASQFVVSECEIDSVADESANVLGLRPVPFQRVMGPVPGEVLVVGMNGIDDDAGDSSRQDQDVHVEHVHACFAYAYLDHSHHLLVLNAGPDIYLRDVANWVGGSYSLACADCGDEDALVLGHLPSFGLRGEHDEIGCENDDG